MEEYRVGWMSRSHGADVSWSAAASICESWSLDEIRSLGIERAALFAGCRIPESLHEDLRLVEREFDAIVAGETSNLVHVSLWNHEVFVAEEDDALILALSRLHAVGALTAAGFSDEF